MNETMFEELVVKPIRAAYRDKFFLGEKYAYDYWYKFLKHANRTKLDCAVECWVHRHSELPVLADIAKSLEL